MIVLPVKAGQIIPLSSQSKVIWRDGSFKQLPVSKVWKCLCLLLYGGVKIPSKRNLSFLIGYPETFKSFLQEHKLRLQLGCIFLREVYSSFKGFDSVWLFLYVKGNPIFWVSQLCPMGLESFLQTHKLRLHPDHILQGRGANKNAVVLHTQETWFINAWGVLNPFMAATRTWP